MYKSVLLPEAMADIRDAARWYDSRQKGLGKRFTSDVRKNVRALCERPEMVAVRYNQTRCAILDHFPFMIHFVIDNESKTLMVIALFHMSRSSDEWQVRAPD